MVTVDESGATQDFLTSGATDEQHRQLVDWPDGEHLFEQLRDLPGPHRIADIGEFARSFGADWNFGMSLSCLCTPLRHLGVHVGNFFIGDKEGPDPFTAQDEEALLLFAAQAGAAIVNARAFRAEQRARADIEALLETSPIGVAVFDAASGRPVMFNREARRLADDVRIAGPFD